MKVDTNAPAYPFQCQGPTTAPEVYYGIPIRLEIASRVLAGMATTEDSVTGWNVNETSAAEHALEAADALIAAHNATQKEEK